MAASLSTGPYVLQPLVEDLPLSAEGDGADIKINCVEFYDQNLYVGTSASEILHFVQIPPDPADPSSRPSYIIASRLPPAYADTPGPRPGVQQILLLPAVNKACILCNSTVTFYSLPELSPVFGTTQVRGCNWIGGIDLNEGDGQGAGESNTVTILLSLNRKIRVVRIGDEPRAIRTIDYAGSTISIRRDSFACVADSRSYALLDVDRQLKIPLFPISSLDESQSSTVGGQVEDISEHSDGSRTQSAARGHTPGNSQDRGHTRNRSIGQFVRDQTAKQFPPRTSSKGAAPGRETPDPLFREASPAPPTEVPIEPAREASPVPVTETATTERRSTEAAPILLKPHIVSPSLQEFLMVTGTTPTDPGIGISVNLEGELTRSTLEFERYPEGLVADGRGVGMEINATNAEDEEEGYVLAAMRRETNGTLEFGIEIQRWDLDPGEAANSKYWLSLPSGNQTNTSGSSTPSRTGIRGVVGAETILFEEVIERLCLKRFRPFLSRSPETTSSSPDLTTAQSVKQVERERELFESPDIPEGWEEHRSEEERSFAKRLGRTRSRLVVWSSDKVWWAVRNPMALRLDASLLPSSFTLDNIQVFESLDRRGIIETLNSLRGREARTETEFLSLGYIRQRAGLLLFISFLHSPPSEILPPEYQAASEALLEGVLDPRVPLSLIPFLRPEVIQGRGGIWISGGIKDLAEAYLLQSPLSLPSNPPDSPNTSSSTNQNILQFLKHYLLAWRRKKGFGSIASETEVFTTIDKCLLLTLLSLDSSSPPGPARPRSIRAELNDLVDRDLADPSFPRAVSILESHNRLFLLSRLYQSRKQVSDVLATWKRILEGEKDVGGEFINGEMRVREYLTQRTNPTLVQEYGLWLAGRNPKLGVQVFADSSAKVQFEPRAVVAMLREGAPGAVKEYLEYLIFGKQHTKYATELISYYLDSVLQALSTSPEAQEMLSRSYETYRALRPPKPTYRQFIADNAIDAEWWRSRLRLLQLLGGSQSHGIAGTAGAAEATTLYDAKEVSWRIEPWKEFLVPETIILGGRAGHHAEALKLLTHRLGDYDTAIGYCLSIGSGTGGASVPDAASSRREQQSKLFKTLLGEFLQIEDISDRVEQTASLLERFGAWLDAGEVLSMIPDTWSVELLSGFLVSVLRRVVRERSEARVVRALAAGENLKVGAEGAGMGGRVEREVSN